MSAPMISERAHAECVRLLDLLTNKRVQESWSWVFMSPVTGIPGYHEIVKKPMDLGTVKRHLGSKPSRCRFKSHERFAKDVRLVFQNALLYNKDDEHVKGSVYDAAQHLLRVFETAYAKAKETVLADEDDASGYSASAGAGTRHDDAPAAPDRPVAAADSAPAAAAPPADGDHTHHHHHHHHHRDHHSKHEGKHKKDKSSKKEKKSKKSKKKSKDKDKDKERERSKDKDRERDRKHSSSSTSITPAATSTTTTPPPPPPTVVDSKASVAPSNPTPVLLGKHAPSVAPRAPSAAIEVSARATAGQNEATSTFAQASSESGPRSLGRPASASSVASSVGGDGSVDSARSIGSGKMQDDLITACLSVLMKLIKYKEGNVSPAAPFLQPVDLSHFPDYRIKVPHRMHLYGVQKKLKSGGYADKDAFAYDVRLIFSNCLIYNSDVILSKVMRSHAVTLMKLFETQFAKIGGTWPGIPERWKCHQIIHDVLSNRTDGQETAQWFKYPIQTYFDSPEQVPYGYFKKIRHPMDIGTVSAKLHLGVYKQSPEFLQDLKLIFDNCVKYWSADPQGQAYCESARVLLSIVKTQAINVLGSSVADPVFSKEKSSKSRSYSSTKDDKHDRDKNTSAGSSLPGFQSSSTGEDERSRKRSGKSVLFPEKEVCMEIVRLLRLHKMKGYRGVEILTSGPFLHAVDTTKYPDYLKIISEPMDFAKIERKLKGDRYVDVNEFCADVHLIFSNCHKYNSDPIEGADIRAMASNLRDYFVDLYNQKFNKGAATTSVDTSKSGASDASRTASSATVTQTAKAPGPQSPKVPKKSPCASPTKVNNTSAQRSGSLSSEVKPHHRLPEAPKKIAESIHTAASPPGVHLEPTAKTSEAADTDAAKVRKKEKKDKKKKDKKDKKKKDKKEKKRDKEKKSKDKSLSGATHEQSTATQSQPTSLLAPRDTQPDLAPSTSSVQVAGGHPSVPVESGPSSASSRSKSKKSKKTDLSDWELICERVLNRLIKIEQVTKLHFDQPLIEVFPQLAAEYKRIIAEPMDLRSLREALHSHSLTAPEFFRRGRLIFENAISFNSADDLASLHIREMSAHLLWYFESLCSELRLLGTSEEKLNRDAQRRLRAELIRSTPMEVKAKECQKLLRVLNSQKYDKNCWPFRKPVQVLFPTLSADYFEIIKKPMDLATIGDKLASLEYKLHGDFIDDVRLTFENAMQYNRADKDREGWSVYSAAVQMVAVAEEQWCDVTLEVLERVRRREILRKERERLNEKKKAEKRVDEVRRPTASLGRAEGTVAESGPARSSSTRDSVLPSSSKPPQPPQATTVIMCNKEEGDSSTKLKLQIVNRASLERMNKSERKAEEKRRKRARREEEIARSEKRRRTAVAATDDALREAELRSRRRLQKLEIAEAVKQREERERKAKEADEARALLARMKFNAAAWTGRLMPATKTSTEFWTRKRVKLEIPAAFKQTINTC